MAELFERKPICQKYTFEVLCDYLADKATKLISRYEAATRERKASREEKSYFYQRRIDALERESAEAQKSVDFAE